MRVFISADIEGTAFTTDWEETQKGNTDYPAAARQMTAEVKAACEGAIAAGRNGNPLSHTNTKKTTCVTLNGEPCSEFLTYSYCCAQYGVPTVFLSGDKTLTEDSKDIHPCLKTVAVKEGWGGHTRCKQPEYACDLIREGAEAALRQNLTNALCTLPSHYVFEVSYKEHFHAVKYANYPGFEKIGSHTIRMETDNLTDVLRAITFVL